MANEPRSATAAILAGLAILLLMAGIYIGSYLTLLDPEIRVAGSFRLNLDRDPAYRFGGEVSEWLFAPANYVDQHVRPKFWHDFLP